MKAKKINEVQNFKRGEDPHRQLGIGVWGNRKHHLKWLVIELETAGFEIDPDYVTNESGEDGEVGVNVVLSEGTYSVENWAMVEIDERNYILSGGCGNEYANKVIYDIKELKYELIIKLESCTGGTVLHRIKTKEEEIKFITDDIHKLKKLNIFKDEFEKKA